MKKVFIIMVMIALVAVAFGVEEIWVRKSGGDYTSINDALTAAVGGPSSYIYVGPGTYTECIDFGGKTTTLKSGFLTSPTARATTIIDANNLGPAVTFSGAEGATTIIKGFTITNGLGGYSEGGGIDGNGSSAMIDDCVIYDCESGSYGQGGGIRDVDGTITNCIIYENTAFSGGGLALCDGTITTSTISANTAEYGGGFYGCDGTLGYNLIQYNTATSTWATRGLGGGLAECDGTINHCTIVYNSASRGGGLYGCSGTIQNSIIWRNTADQNSSRSMGECATPSYSDVMNQSQGTGVIDTDPLFTEEAIGDFTLAALSPCKDAGVPYLIWDDGLTTPTYVTVYDDLGRYPDQDGE